MHAECNDKLWTSKRCGILLCWNLQYGVGCQKLKEMKSEQRKEPETPQKKVRNGQIEI